MIRLPATIVTVAIAISCLAAPAAAQASNARATGAKAFEREDYVEARKWYQVAADQGDASAQASLGYIYEYGLGVVRDDAEAVRWYQLSANQGLATAQFNLGLKYAKGESVPRDLIEAYRWYNLAASQGDTDAAKHRDVLAGEMTSQQIAEAKRRSADWRPSPVSDATGAGAQIAQSKPIAGSTTSGAGFFVTPAGHFITDTRVIEGCSALSLRGGARLEILSADPGSGLALLRATAGALRPPLFIRSEAIGLSENVTVADNQPGPRFSTESGAISGNVSALPAPGDDRQLLQTSLPFQSVGIGSPLMDSKGRVAGIVTFKTIATSQPSETKADAAAVTYAISAEKIRTLLTSYGLEAPSSATNYLPSTAEIALISRAGTTQVECWK